MRHPNGYGTVKKLSGKRRKPFAAIITTGYSIEPSTDKIAFLEPILSPELYAQVLDEYTAFIGSQPKGKQIQKAIGYYATRQEALIALAEYNKAPYKLEKKAATFADVYNAILPEISKGSKSRLTGYKSAFSNSAALHNRKIAELTAADLQAVINSNSGKSETVQRQIITLFRSIYNYADANNLVNKNYSRFVKIAEFNKAAEKTIYTPEDIELLWDNISWRQKNGSQAADSLIIMLYTGLRINELLSLNRQDVDIANRIIHVHGTKTAAADRLVPIHKDILPILEKRCNEHSDALYLNSRGNRLAYRKFAEVFEDYKAATGLSHTIHELRHTFITLAMAQELDVVLLKKIVGHKLDITAGTYTHPTEEQLVAFIDKLVIR